MKKTIALIFLFIFFQATFLFAQQNMVLRNMFFMPQNTYVNPGAMPNDRFSLGLPLLSNTYLSANSNSFAYNDLIKKGPTDSLYFDINNVVGMMKDQGLLNVQFQTDLLFVGLRFKKSYIMVNATEKFESQFEFSKDMLNFLWNGNAGTMGRTQNISLALNMNHYREVGFYYARDFFNKLKIGVRYKMLFGMENITCNASSLNITTDSTTYDLSVSSDLNINSAGLSVIDISNVKNYFLSQANKGRAFDFGATYRFNSKFSLGASVLDIGRINWTQDSKNFRTATPSATYSYSGANIGSIISDSLPTSDVFKNSLDSIKETFRIAETPTTYVTKLKPTIFLSGNYFFGQFTFLTAIIQARKALDGWKGTYGLAFNARLGTLMDLGFNYTYNRDIRHNFGFGLVFYSGNASIMIASDNLIGAIRFKDTRFVNARIGIAFHFGKYFLDNDRDNDQIPDDEDKCPGVFGPPESDGCPDSDGDKIIDSEDDCPREPGSKALNGCPDRDTDGIIDKFDDCPDLAGEPEFKGCPDRDHDGIMDIDDKCPLDVGTKELKGCPDKDGDGIGDGDDLCPEKKGSLSNSGCPPDADKDGVFDDEDKCPDLAGEVQNKGCPNSDTDSDGVFDADDDCLYTSGSPDNKGCPVITQEEIEVINKATEQVEFDESSTELKSSSYQSLEALATLLKSREGMMLKIISHSDNEGSESAKMKLTEDRSLSIKQFLVNKIVNPTQIICEFYGGSKPIGDNNTPEGRRRNNRTELIIKYK
jgi:outer membrane protein OmpA-like peptidoglycan-associated protein